MGKFKFTKISWLHNVSNRAKNIDQIIKDFSHRTVKKMQFLMGESCPLYIYYHGIENPWNLFENLRLINLKS